jgi:hypothetical protein
VSGSQSKSVGLWLTPLETKSSCDSRIGGNDWWEAVSTVDNLLAENRSDVPLGQLLVSSALPSTATIVSKPRALTNRGPSGIFSKFRLPSISSSQVEFDSAKVADVTE